MTDIIQLSPTELKQWQDEGRAFHLLDVRTDEERAICTLPAAIHIPMNLIPLRQNELPDDDLPIVVYCHQIGRASCRERVKISEGAVSLKKKKGDTKVRTGSGKTTRQNN